MFEYEEAMNAKRDFLQTEISLLKIAKIMKVYQILRKKELQTKVKLAAKMRGTETNIKKIQKILPQIQTTEVKIHPSSKIQKKRIKYDQGIEDELRDIQNQLDALQR